MFKIYVFCDIIQSMKNRILIFSSLLCLCGTNQGFASDCKGEGCYLEPISAPIVQETTVIEAPIPVNNYTNYAAPVEYMYPYHMPMREVKMLSIKPVPADNREPVWDGTAGQYQAKALDKTVDWRDGVPIWDDSVSSYKLKDYSDWFLEPMPELYIRESDKETNEPAATKIVNTPVDRSEEINIIELYKQNMADAAATRARVEELLSPKKPVSNLWTNDDTSTETVEETVKVEMPTPKPEYTAQDLTEVVKITFGRSDGCPFETETECEIWRRKPIVRETVSPRSPKIRADKIYDFISAAQCNENITANEAVSAPLLERYKMLMNSANACCTDGMAYSLKQAGATDGLIYKFLADDANFYGLGARCLMMTDQDLDTKYPNTATAAVVADVRNGCLCRGRQWFEAMLAPFKDVYKAMPEFKDYKFYYTYTDGLQREITVSVNNDVQNVLNQLALCP